MSKAQLLLGNPGPGPGPGEPLLGEVKETGVTRGATAAPHTLPPQLRMNANLPAGGQEATGSPATDARQLHQWGFGEGPEERPCTELHQHCPPPRAAASHLTCSSSPTALPSPPPPGGQGPSLPVHCCTSVHPVHCLAQSGGACRCVQVG